MPFYGGIVGVNKVSSPESFDAAKRTIKGITVSTGSLEAAGNRGYFAFTVFKVDNIDFSQRNVRIVNSKGEPDYSGRVEMRANGEWGTVNKQDTDLEFAQLVCELLGFQNAVKEENCASFQGQNYCGADSAPVNFKGIKCKGMIYGKQYTIN